MEPNRIGRMLGIGARVAGAKLREQADRLGTAQQPSERSAAGAPARAAGARIGAGAAQAARNFRAAQASSGSAQARAANLDAAPGAGTVSPTRRMTQGAAQFGAALVRPFAHATNLLWNQITGIFFALFAAFFVEHAWMVYRAARWHDRHVFLYGGLGAVFAWFAASTFWRVRQKQRRHS
jgi:hypothetical protein